MRINKKVYPKLESIRAQMGINPLYISDHFRDECRNNESKFFDEADSFYGLFFSKSFKSIACRPFIYLYKGGGIVYGLHGEWISFVDERGHLFKVVMEDGKWTMRNLMQPEGYELRVNKTMATEALKEIRLIGLFKEFADIKEKILPAKGKAKEFNCRYKSDFNFPIGLLTENWYTESCQNHPFVVRGHWRWQAHGKGLEERKLIWIDPFTKDGYTKGAYKDA